MMADLPPDLRAEVQRILDAEARRLLAEELHGDAPGAATGSDEDTPDRRADQRPPPVCEPRTMPIARRVHDAVEAVLIAANLDPAKGQP